MSSALLLLVTALALSIGWGIRGNYGHETGAMIPGALAAMAGVLTAGRADWLKRLPLFAFFGALGWSFGGSISYMQVIGYTHSGHSLSVFYGFACLWLIGFLWAAFGGAGTALAACLDEDELSSLLGLVIVIFAAWTLQDVVIARLDRVDSAFRQNDPLYWYDTDWFGVTVAMAATLLWCAVRRRFDSAASLVLHMAVGWWAGFLILVVLLGWRMTPPRGDNWAGCTGMVIGLWVYLERRGLRLVTISSVIAGAAGGIGFAAADLFKLAGIRTGWATNWHSVLEQSYGFVNGLGTGLVLLFLARRAPEPDGSEAERWFPKYFATAFVLIVITWVNLWKNVGIWVQAKAVPALLYGWPALAWFSAGYSLLAALIILLLCVHRRGALNFVPGSDSGKGELLFLVFLWWIVIGNFERAVVAFAPQRLITEGVIFVNAILCTALVLTARKTVVAPIRASAPKLMPFATAAIASAVFVSCVSWMGTRLLYGDTQAGYASRHIRFGPDATATDAKPAANQPHP